MTGGLALLTTGGTIAMQWAAGRGADLAAPPGPALAAALPGLDIRHEAVFAKPSAGITLDDIRTLAALAERHAAAGTPVVITHGTDTLEETAFALELFTRAAAPIVLTGAMRAAGRPGADGEANLIAACRVAMVPDAREKGVLVVMDEEIHWAPLVRKIHASRIHAFSSAPLGPIGWVSEGRPRFRLAPARRLPHLAPPDRSVRVPLLEIGTADETALLEALAGTAWDALVLSLPGGGHIGAALLPLLERLPRDRPIVFASRTGGGETLSESYAYAGGDRDLVARGLIPAGALDARKARIALAALAAAGAPREDIEAFYRGA